MTITGPTTLATIEPRGHIGRRRELPQPLLGLFALEGSMLWQPAILQPDAAVLRVGNPWDGSGEAIGALRSVEFGTRAETLARNLVGCGTTQVSALPCWFNRGKTIDRVSRAGGLELLPIGLIDAGRPSRGTDTIEERGPIIDAHIDRRGVVWVLLQSSTPRPDRLSLARYSETGEAIGVSDVGGRPRLILDAVGDEALLLAGTGQFMSVAVP